MQVFDLTRLRDQTNFQTFSADARLTSIAEHNIAVNETTGFAYVIMHAQVQPLAILEDQFIDINNPTQPVEVGGYAGSSIHTTLKSLPMLGLTPTIKDAKSSSGVTVTEVKTIK